MRPTRAIQQVLVIPIGDDGSLADPADAFAAPDHRRLRLRGRVQRQRDRVVERPADHPAVQHRRAVRDRSRRRAPARSSSRRTRSPPPTASGFDRRAPVRRAQPAQPGRRVPVPGRSTPVFVRSFNPAGRRRPDDDRLRARAGCGSRTLGSRRRRPPRRRTGSRASRGPELAGSRPIAGSVERRARHRHPSIPGAFGRRLASRATDARDPSPRICPDAPRRPAHRRVPPRARPARRRLRRVGRRAPRHLPPPTAPPRPRRRPRPPDAADPTPGTALNACEIITPDDVKAATGATVVNDGEFREKPTSLHPASPSAPTRATGAG